MCYLPFISIPGFWVNLQVPGSEHPGDLLIHLKCQAFGSESLLGLASESPLVT